MNPSLPNFQSRPLRSLSLGPGIVLAVLLALGTTPIVSTIGRAAEAGSTNAPNPLLTVERIFKGSEFGGEGFGGHWLEDSSGYVTWEKPASGGPGQDLVRHDPATDKRDVLLAASELIPAGKTQPLSVDDYAWSTDRSKVLIYTNSKKVWRTHARGDYWVLDRTSHELFQIGGNAPDSSLMFAKFSPDGTHVAYVRDRNLYSQDLRSRKVTTLTDTPNEHLIHGAFDWVYEEEFSMQDGFRWSPDSKSIAFWQLDTEGVREVSLVNNTDSLYPQVQRIPYPKTGELNSACRIGVVDAAGGDIRWMKTPGDPREHYIHDLQWIPRTRRLLLQQLNRLQNTNRVFVAESATGEVIPLLVDSDKAWVEAHNDLTWHSDGRRFLFWSERDQWQHLYWAGLKNGKLKPATRGAFDVTELVRVQEARQELYFTASPDNPTQRYLYRSSFRGGSPERLTPTNAPGTHKYVASPDGRWAFHTVSSFTVPPKTELISLPDHKTVRVLADNQKIREKLATLKVPTTEFFRVPVGDGLEIDGWCVLPPEFDRTKKHPLLVHVYGEPAGQTVKDQWGGSSQLWHWMLAQQGYVVMSFDNRGTATPRGHDWRKSIYRQVGILASQDQAAALKHVLATRPYLDPQRVGIWGWSGGGSMTLNALLRHPDLYTAGISIASVPNMRLYDTIYQERYMGLPSDNAEGYRQGSPLTFADRLQGKLLLIHGTGDDNCHYQGAEALVNAFITHGKQFRMMSYPNRSHSINEGLNTSVHLRQLMTDFLHETLPPGPR
jgi:dipeptidyl-peptidase-4